MSNYRYYIKFVGEEVEVFPLNTNKLKFETKPEEGQIFYRTKMAGKVKLYKQDFDYIYAIEKSRDRCETLGLRVERVCNGSPSWEWEGTFSLNDGRWDLDLNTFEFEAQVKDKYSCVIDNKKKAVNVLELTQTVQTQADLSPLGLEYSKVCIGQLTLATRVVTTGVRGGPVGVVPDISNTDTPTEGEYINDCVVEAEGWQVYKVVYRDPQPAGPGQRTFTVETTFFREVLETFDVAGLPSMPPGDGWINQESSTISGSATTIWVRKPYGGTEMVYTLSSQARRLNNPYNSNASEIVTIKELKFTNQTNFIYDKCRYFKDAVWYTANKYCGSIPGVISDFFQANPDGTAPDNEEYQVAKANLSLLMISQKSDVLRPTPITPKEVPVVHSPRYYTAPQQKDNQTKSIEGATKGLLTWEQMEEILKGMFNVYWDIDNATGAIRLEHISYYYSQPGLDLTQEKYRKNLLGRKKYEYDKASMPQIENFEFMEKSFDIDFLGSSILYKTICVNQEADSNSVLYKVSQVTNDLNLIFSVKEAISQDGFVLFQNFIDTEDENKVKVGVQEGFISGAPGVNKHLSWANLHYNYHRWGRVLSNGIMNNFETPFTSYRKTKRQDTIKISLCCDEVLYPQRYFITQLSNQGELRSMIHNILDDTIELSIYHGIDDSGASPFGRQFDDSFDLSFK